ncbi:glycosyltransferase family 39 protein [Rhodococcus sp. NPDC003318]|uniref:glycosyltransferase family 39 protein n=1 Tax=Rhodococcus sp. NPDC003318 TaxID=3364503 RepID=UPI0036C5D7B4
MTTTSVLDHEPVVPDAPTPRPRPRWEPWALAALLIGTAVGYLWNLGASGWANSFYSAAVQAGSVSWKAFFFGSSDAANSITVDKPPASLWVMELSVRAFGLNSWSILAPQALMGVASVALLWAIVRRYFGAGAGLLAGLVLAVTPVAALMFKFNNPDALLVLLTLAAAWALLRGIEDGRTRWLVLTGVFVGLGFLTKQLQVMLVVPPLALTYLLFGPPKLGKRIAQLFAALAAMVVSAGWWLLAVELWPADSRPWIGGSQNNSILELTLGYNGLGRLNGDETGSVTPGRGGAATDGAAAQAAGDAMAGAMPGGGGPGGGGGMWGNTGITRMFEAAQGGQIAWLIPAALILGVLGIVLRGKLARTDTKRATFVLFGAWLLTTGLVFSFMAGIFHSYYTVALAPMIGALVGAGAVTAWRHRDLLWVRIVSAVTMVVTAVWSWELLGRSADFVPWLRWVILVVGIAAAAALLLPRLTGRLAAGAAVAAVLAAVAGPTAYAIDTVTTPHTGSIVTAGPNTGGMGFGGRGGPGGADGRSFGQRGGQAGQMLGGPAGQMPGGQAGQMPQGGQMGQTGRMPGATGTAPGAAGQLPGGMTPGGTAPAPNGAAQVPGGGQTGQLPAGAEAGQTAGGMGGGPAGGLLNGSKPSSELTAMLTDGADRYTWVAAAVGSNSASGYQLATQRPVMPVGGFNGSDPSPTLEQFQQYVADGKIHYFIGGGGGGFGGGMGGSSNASEISQWVTENFTSTTVDGVTLYDLTSPTTRTGT